MELFVTVFTVAYILRFFVLLFVGDKGAVVEKLSGKMSPYTMRILMGWSVFVAVWGASVLGWF